MEQVRTVLCQFGGAGDGLEAERVAQAQQVGAALGARLAVAHVTLQRRQVQVRPVALVVQLAVYLADGREGRCVRSRVPVTGAISRMGH